MRTLCVIRACFAVVVLAWVVLSSAVSADTAQPSKSVEEHIGTVTIAETEIGLLIAYRPDSAVLQLSIQDHGDPVQYLPLMASTYRGIPPVDIDLYASRDDTVIWVLSSLPSREILAHYRLGAKTGQNAFGAAALSDTAFPDFLSGGPIPYPVFAPQAVSRRATFYHRPHTEQD